MLRKYFLLSLCAVVGTNISASFCSACYFYFTLPLQLQSSAPLELLHPNLERVFHVVHEVGYFPRINHHQVRTMLCIYGRAINSCPLQNCTISTHFCIGGREVYLIRQQVSNNDANTISEGDVRALSLLSNEMAQG